jgi:nucleoside-diphosphate kinase
MVRLSNHAIKELIPHSPPFLLVDEVEILEKGKKCTGKKYVGSNEWFFQGHFPNHPIMPGVIQVECVAQLGCVLCAHAIDPKSPVSVLLCTIDSARFKKPVGPGCTLEMTAEVKRKIGQIVAITGSISVDNEIVAEVELKAMYKYNHEYTLSIIKPDSYKKGHAEEIIKLLELNGLTVASFVDPETGIRRPLRETRHLTKEEAQGFYKVHSERQFFDDLCNFMSSDKCVVMVLGGTNAVAKYREIMGATDPAKAANGTIRKLYGASIDENSVHGSDSHENSKIEIEYFFPEFAQTIK